MYFAGEDLQNLHNVKHAWELQSLSEKQCNSPLGQLCESNKRLSLEIQCFRKQFLFDDCTKATKKKKKKSEIIKS